MLLHAAVVRGEHTPSRDEFRLRSLCEDLGLDNHPRIDILGASGLGATVRLGRAARLPGTVREGSVRAPAGRLRTGCTQ